MTEKALNLSGNVEPKRDAYGFSVRPQHLQRYKEYTGIYKEEEEERSSKWKYFLEQHLELAQPGFSKECINTHDPEGAGEKEVVGLKGSEGVDLCNKVLSYDGSTEGDFKVFCSEETKSNKPIQWALTKPSIGVIEKMMSLRINSSMNCNPFKQIHTQSIQEVIPLGEDHGDDSEDDYFEDMLDESLNGSPQGSPTCDVVFTSEQSFPWKELEFLVHGGVPRGIRGEVWQAFVGVGVRRVDGYYQDLFVPVTNMGDCMTSNNSLAYKDNAKLLAHLIGVPEKWGKQIEKDLPRTFPGHPALCEDGRNSLRRLLLAYARHNPKVGYCQAMNFFAGLILLMMAEENAFWALVGIIDDYFGGYYTEEMIESQVDQLVFEELMRERFPKLVHHLDYLGVEVAWLSGPWFLTIFVNILPWESVLRVWDVLLFEGNRVMLFRTALALMELYGPALVTTKDAGDAVTLLQSLTGSTFDSSQLVLTACVGFMGITETRLQELRGKHRPTVLEVVRERKMGGLVSQTSKGLASKLYSFKHDPQSIITQTSTEERLGPMITNADMPLPHTISTDFDKILSGIAVNSEVESIPDLQDQVVWLKVEMCRLLEEKRSATLRAEELETALMEMVKQDNRRQLSARVEQLEQQLGELHQAIADKREQETAMLQVLMRVEQEQKVTEDARLSAEQDVAAQKYAVHVLQEKHEKAMASIEQMEKRVVMAESMLEATLQYESGQLKNTHSSPRSAHPSNKTGLLSMPFVLGWRDKNKGRSADLVQTSKNNCANGEAEASAKEHQI